MIERSIDFSRLRRMRCGRCGHETEVSDQWIHSWEQGQQRCAQCGIDCTEEDRADYVAHPADPALTPADVTGMYWYHTSTHANWPDTNFDPIASLTEETKARMESMTGPGAVARWAARQKRKALHIGTYEAAIENTLRRMRDQSSESSDFYLYRVQLDPQCRVAEGVHPEPTDFVGDTDLASVAGSQVDLYRYINVHEDPGSISAAITNRAIGSVQRLTIPQLPPPLEYDYLVRHLSQASGQSTASRVTEGMRGDSSLSKLLRSRQARTPDTRQLLWVQAAKHMPQRIRARFEGAFSSTSADKWGPDFTAYTAGMLKLIESPPEILAALNEQPWRPVSGQ